MANVRPQKLSERKTGFADGQSSGEKKPVFSHSLSLWNATGTSKSSKA